MDAGHPGLSVRRQCELLGLSASSMYYHELLPQRFNTRLWAGGVLSLVGQTSMNTALDGGNTVDLSPAMKRTGTLDAVLLERFSQSHIDGQDCGILRCVGISGQELSFARKAGIEALRQKLMIAGVYAATRCRRESVV